MAYILNKGKFFGVSLEEIALGKKVGTGSKVQGYKYFHMLANGEPEYFDWFQNDKTAMARWNEIHSKLNNYVSPLKCSSCNKNPISQISVAGEERYGYSMGLEYSCCNNKECSDKITCMPSGHVALHDVGFDTILRFCTRKFDQDKVTDLLRQIAGWNYNLINADHATEFIDHL